MAGSARARVIVFVAGLVACAFVAWPGFSIDRDGEWRSVLAGFQLQKESGDFIGAAQSLIHFHGLDGREGIVRFSLAPRIPNQATSVNVTWNDGSQSVVLGTSPTSIEVPFFKESDLEIHLDVPDAENPRPLVLSDLRIERAADTRCLLISVLPTILGLLVLTLLSRDTNAWVSLSASLVTVAASAAGLVAALDPVRTLSFPPLATSAAPLLFVFAFVVAGLLGSSRTSVAVALLGATLSLHIHTVHSGFVYDDRLWSRPWTPGELASTFAGSEDPRGISGEQYRPIPSVTHATDHFLWGSSPGAFHVVNMVLHAASAFLLFLLLERLRFARSPAILGALTLLVHPLAASSVGWISERTDTLADIFMLATLIVFLGPKGTQPLRVLGVALLALWSKETAVMLPVLAMTVAIVGLDAESRRARLATIRALTAFVVLYIAVWVSLFPEKAAGRAMATADTLRSSESGWVALFGNLASQLIHPIGFEQWRSTKESLPVSAWFIALVVFGVGAVVASVKDRRRSVAWQMIVAGLVFSAAVVLPFRGHDAVDIYRLGHSPTLGFAIVVAAAACLARRDSLIRNLVVAMLLIGYFGPTARETSAAWGYPGFQFRMALRFNLENPTFLAGLDPEMKTDLGRESRFEAHRDNPLAAPFEP